MPKTFFHRLEKKDAAFKNYLTNIDEFSADARNKYKNRTTTIDGILFDSKKEAARYEQLKLLLAAKQIKDLEIHKVFELQGGFRDFEKNWVRPITYEADFYYEDLVNDCFTVEDVKPSFFFKTDVYRIKRKLFLKKYPHVVFREIY